MIRRAAFLLCLALAMPAQAQIVFDGSTGTGRTGPLLPLGGRFFINGTDGTQFGSNLLHSFSEFNIQGGEIARFQPGTLNPNSVSRILTRVTGGQMSTLAGTLEVAYPNADFVFVNPSGVVFGPGVRLDVPGAFFVSTGNELYFSGLDEPIPTGVAQVLQVDPLQDFGFFEGVGFTDAAPLEPDIHLDGAVLRMERTQQTLGLAGQHIAFDAAIATSANGAVSIASIGTPGRVDWVPESGFTRLRIREGSGGLISLSESVISTSGIEPPGVPGPTLLQPGSGPIFIEGGDFDAVDSNVNSITAGALDGGDIEIDLDGRLSFRLELFQGVGIFASKVVDPRVGSGEGDAGNVTVHARNVQLLEGATIGSATEDVGDAGTVRIHADEDVLISGRDPLFDPPRPGGIFANSSGAGRAGDITVSARALKLERDGAIVSEVSGAGPPGTITIDVDRLELRSNGRIDTSTRSLSPGGNIEITASESVLVTGASGPERFSGITTLAQPDAPAGSRGGVISIDTPQLTVTDGGQISAASLGPGDAGDIEVTGPLDGFAESIEVTRGAITTAAPLANGGNISLKATREILVTDGEISASVNVEQGRGGDITIDPEIVILRNGRIVAQAGPGTGGNIKITTDFFFADESSVVSATGATQNGAVEINAPEVDLTNDLFPPEAEFVDPGALLSDQCAARARGGEGSFIVEGDVGLPDEPRDPRRPVFLPGSDDAGAAAFERGDFEGALQRWNAALASGNTQNRSALRLKLAQTYLALGSPARAQESLSELSDPSLAEARRVLEARLDAPKSVAEEVEAFGLDPTQPETAALLELARPDADLELATAHLEQAAPSHSVLIARIHLALRIRDRARAGRVLADAGLEAVRVRADRAAAHAWGELGALYLEEQRFNEALEATRRALRFAQRPTGGRSAYRWHWQMARILAENSRDAEALPAYRRAYAALLEQRTRAGGLNARPLIRELVDALLRNAASLEDARQREALVLEARDRLDDETAVAVQDFFHDECIASQRVVAPEALPDALVVYPVVLPDRTELIVSDANGTRSILVEETSSTILEQVALFGEHVQNRAHRRYLEPAARLYDWLVRPLAPTLREAAPSVLVFVPSGALRGLPFAALYDQEHDQHLIEQIPVAIVPGLSLVDPKPLPAKLRLLKAGITTPVQGFAPLPYVEPELAALGEQFPGALLVDESFDEASLRRELNDKPYDALHIASHAQFGSQLDQTFLVTYDGRLNISELAELVAVTRFRDRPLELLSLSACETAVGDERSALGLAGASLKAGARSTLATLWFVNDLAASELVRDFYGEIRAQTSRARALQQAQLRMMERRELRHPAHWSGFVIIGAWL